MLEQSANLSNYRRPLGIIAGQGALPKMIIEEAKKLEIPIFVVGFKDIVNINLEGVHHKIIPITKVGSIIRALKKEKIKEIIVVGRVKRPNFSRLFPDFTGFMLVWEIVKGGFSDDKIFRTVADFLESYDFEVISPGKYFPNIMVTTGQIGNVILSEQQKNDVDLGIEALKAIGKFDIGQALIAKDGVIYGVEAQEGTDELIRRCGKLIEKKGAVLVKFKKPNQDPRIDLPVIGPETLQNAALANISAIALEAGSAIIVDYEETLRYANANNIAIFGI